MQMQCSEDSPLLASGEAPAVRAAAGPAAYSRKGRVLVAALSVFSVLLLVGVAQTREGAHYPGHAHQELGLGAHQGHHTHHAADEARLADGVGAALGLTPDAAKAIVTGVVGSHGQMGQADGPDAAPAAAPEAAAASEVRGCKLNTSA